MNDAVIKTLSATLGAASALGADRVIRRLGPRRRVVVHGSGLAGAAGAYLVGRTGWRDQAPVAREIAGLVVYSATAAIGTARANTNGCQILGTAWITHAIFDIAHHRGRHSRVPAWYPAVCAGYDVAVGALLLRLGQSIPDTQ